MIYFIIFLAGFLNGMFSTGAGQLLVFFLIYIMKFETHKSRILSVSILSISSLFSIFGYSKEVKIDFTTIIILIIISIFSGYIGGKIMKNISGDSLNLIGGIIITMLTIYKIIS